MLVSLTIQNIVLIDKLTIELAGGLCALTGETGAGKSILLDALGLALGARANAGALAGARTGARANARAGSRAGSSAGSSAKCLPLIRLQLLVIAENMVNFWHV